ncbi:HD-GYP domain-containing protein [Marinimicrobium alkaliphilum]|uniref:HD-GYP domain-containing protein n=1 Tax=Marinimicrobium alkaliphilum TaxID=2202654 RepID=UPI000DB94E53|nr:HD-GYP domain-containing protein [Marinimicrobium alkaliphilum]
MGEGSESIQVHVSELQVGMYVSKLDRDWLETPFLMQGFLIEHPDDIDTLAEYATYVWVDAVPEPRQRTPERPAAAARKSVPPARKTTSYINKIPAREEHRQALGVYRTARKLTRSLLDEARLRGVIDTQGAKETVRSCVDSILRNPDALIWMTRIRSEDEYTAEHCLNVCILAIAFGRHLGLSEDALEELGLCGLLHDVGKMRVPTEILNKRGSLTPKELKTMRAHTVFGRNLLMASPGVYRGAIDVAHNHHEQMDGKGYPRGLAATGISEYTRIVAIVDAYDAMTADRCYASARPTTDALKVLYQARGTQFDEALTLAFLKCVGLYPPGSLVELKNGLVGFVLETSQRYRQLPKVIVINRGELPLERQRIIDLSLIEQGKLKRDFLIQRVHADGHLGLALKDFQRQGLVLKH